MKTGPVLIVFLPVGFLQNTRPPIGVESSEATQIYTAIPEWGKTMLLSAGLCMVVPCILARKTCAPNNWFFTNVSAMRLMWDLDNADPHDQLAPGNQTAYQSGPRIKFYCNSMLFLSGISNIWWHCFAVSTSNKKLIFMILRSADVKEKCCKCSWNGQFRVETTKCFNRCDSRYQGGVLRIDGKTPGFPLILTNDSSFARESAFHNQTSSSLRGMEMMKENNHQKHICFFCRTPCMKSDVWYVMFTDLLRAKMYCKTLWIEARAQIHRSC